MNDDWRCGFWRIRASTSPHNRAINLAPRDELGNSAYAIARGEVHPSTPFFFEKVGKASRLVDMTTTSQIEIVSKRFLETMRLAKVTGYVSYDAIVLINENERLEDAYFVLGITGRAGPVDWLSTPVEPAAPVNGLELGGLEYVGLAFDTSTWDGSDLFLLKGTTFVIGTERVVDTVNDSGLTNIECIPLAEFRTVYDDGDDT